MLTKLGSWATSNRPLGRINCSPCLSESKFKRDSVVKTFLKK